MYFFPSNLKYFLRKKHFLAMAGFARPGKLGKRVKVSSSESTTTQFFPHMRLALGADPKHDKNKKRLRKSYVNLRSRQNADCRPCRPGVKINMVLPSLLLRANRKQANLNVI